MFGLTVNESKPLITFAPCSQTSMKKSIKKRVGGVDVSVDLKNAEEYWRPVRESNPDSSGSPP